MTASATGGRLARVRDAGVIAVLRAPNADAAISTADALVRGGITGIEVTYSTPDTPAVIRELTGRYGTRVSVGAGTVTTIEQAAAAAEAGAEFLVSPGTVPAVCRAMRETGRTIMTGALTPSEIMTAMQLGVDAVKIFPASLVGPDYLRALRGPLPDMALVPTGGVSPENLADWFSAGAAAVGVGSDLASVAAIRDSDWADLEARAKRFAGALASVRGSREVQTHQR